MLKKFLPVLSLPLLLLAGCATPFISTNLTPLQQSRTTNNLYTLEVAVSSHQQTLRWSSIHPQVAVNHEFYPMRPTRLMTNRWEATVPLPAGANSAKFRYIFDFERNAFGSAKPDTMVSKEYTLKIVE